MNGHAPSIIVSRVRTNWKGFLVEKAEPAENSQAMAPPDDLSRRFRCNRRFFFARPGYLIIK
jgi:hypothetical protein